MLAGSDEGSAKKLGFLSWSPGLGAELEPLFEAFDMLEMPLPPSSASSLLPTGLSSMTSSSTSLLPAGLSSMMMMGSMMGPSASLLSTNPSMMPLAPLGMLAGHLAPSEPRVHVQAHEPRVPVHMHMLSPADGAAAEPAGMLRPGGAPLAEMLSAQMPSREMLAPHASSGISSSAKAALPTGVAGTGTGLEARRGGCKGGAKGKAASRAAPTAQAVTSCLPPITAPIARAEPLRCASSGQGGGRPLPTTAAHALAWPASCELGGGLSCARAGALRQALTLPSDPLPMLSKMVVGGCSPVMDLPMLGKLIGQMDQQSVIAQMDQQPAIGQMDQQPANQQLANQLAAPASSDQ